MGVYDYPKCDQLSGYAECRSRRPQWPPHRVGRCPPPRRTAGRTRIYIQPTGRIQAPCQALMLLLPCPPIRIHPLRLHHRSMITKNSLGRCAEAHCFIKDSMTCCPSFLVRHPLHDSSGAVRKRTQTRMSRSQDPDTKISVPECRTRRSHRLLRNRHLHRHLRHPQGTSSLGE